MTDKEIVKRLRNLVKNLRQEADRNLGSCATGLKDYQHSHAWASNCSACEERADKQRMAKELETLLKES